MNTVPIGPWQVATGALGIALAASLVWGVRVDGLRASHMAAHAETKRSYRDAQEKARAAFDAQLAIVTAQNRRLNGEADQKSDNLRIVYRDRTVGLPSAPAGCAPGGADLPHSDIPPRHDGRGGDTVLLTRGDALICTTNTARLETARNWALEMSHEAD